MAEFLNNLNKIRLRRNTKRPTNKWSDIRNHSKHIDNAKFNVGIVCGAINNVFVLDIDIKDDVDDDPNQLLLSPVYATRVTTEDTTSSK